MSITTEFNSIGPEHPTYLIAEIGLNHNGSLELAREIVTAAAGAGAHAAKFQLYASDAFIDEQSSLGDAGPGSLRDFFRQFELKQDEWAALAEHTRAAGLDFFCSVFDRESLDFYLSLEPRLIKIASCDVDNRLLIEDCRETKLPLLISTGTATQDEVARAVEWLGDSPAVLMQCVSSYPAQAEDYNLNVLPAWAERYGLPVGLSDHCEHNYVSLASVALGACVIERHFTSARSLPGPDQALSLEPSHLADLAAGVKAVRAGLGTGRKAPTASEEPARVGGRRSLHVRSDVRGGVKRQDLIALRPGGGVSPAEYERYLGRSVTDVTDPNGR